MDWTQFVIQVGFPGSVALLLMHWTAKRIEKSEDRSELREKGMAVRIGQLEDKIEKELVDLVRDQGGIINEAKNALSGCTAVLQDVTSVLSRLKQSSPSLNVPPGSDIIVRGRPKDSTRTDQT
jgi:CRISPR/Cas system-associated endonuclease Cas3-HD